MQKKYFWKIEPRNLIFRSEIIVYSKILEIIKPFIGKRIRVLDAGCGTGKLATILSSKNLEVFGIDKSDEAIKEAKANYKTGEIHYQVGDVTKLSKIYNKSFFDVIISTFVTLYLNKFQLKQFINEAYKVLKHNGLFILADVHPFLPIIQPKTRWEKWKFKKINYFKTKLINQDIFLPKDVVGNKRKRFSVRWYHHPLYSYINILTRKFNLEKVYEPQPIKANLRQYKNMWGEEKIKPVYIIFYLRKK